MQADFSSDAVGAADKYGLLSAIEIGLKRSSKAAYSGQDSSHSRFLCRRMRTFNLVLEALDRLVLRLDAHAALFVGKSAVLHASILTSGVE